jgi:putative membrane protein
VLQLVTAGGTFPWQTLPGPLAALHKVLPMGYVVDGLRQVMYGGDLSRVWTDLAVVGIWALVAAAITIAGVTRMTHYLTMGQLQPSILQ